MKISIEIPIAIDGTLTLRELDQLRVHIANGIQNSFKPALAALRECVKPNEPRMLGTVMRFNFGEPEIVVE